MQIAKREAKKNELDRYIKKEIVEEKEKKFSSPFINL